MISEPFIRRPVATSLLAAGVMIFGSLAYHFLPVAPLPNVEFPTIFVSAGLPGVDPQTAATSLASPLERRFSNISGVNEITSSSSIGGTTVVLQFDLNRSIEGAARDVQAAINAAANELPLDLPSPPSYRKANPNDAPAMVLALTSDAFRLSELYNFAYQLVVPKISQIPGVSQVDIGGGAKSAVRIQLNPPALASMGLTLDDVRNVIMQVNTPQLPKGSLDGQHRSWAVNSNDQLFDAEDYNDIIIANKNGVPVPLSAVGQAIDANENIRQSGSFNGQRAVLLIIRKQADANIIATVDKIQSLLPLMQSWLPPAVKISVLSDRTATIRASVHDVQLALVVSVALVVMVCFLFLRRFWPTFIASVTVPLSLAGTFGAMWALDFSLDNISLMALTVAVGFVVDDAIVVIENIVRYLDKGYAPLQAALAGAKQIGFTVVSISLSLVAVFIPLLFMGGITGRLFHEFSVTLCAAIVISAIISLTLTPMLCSRFLTAADLHRKDGWFLGSLERGFEWVLAKYAKSLQWVLQHSFLMLAATAAAIGLTVWLYYTTPKGLFPSQDTGILSGSTEAAQGTSFANMVEKQRQVTEIIMKDPAVKAVGDFIGGGGGSTNSGRMFITLKPKGERKETADEVVSRLREAASHLPGISVYLSSMQDIRAGGRASKSPFVYSLQGTSFSELKEWAPKLMAKMREYPQLKDITSDQEFQGLQTVVVVNRDVASRLGIQPQQVDSTLYSAFGQRQVSKLYTERDQYRVILEADPSFQQDPSSLDKIYLKSNTGEQVPLSTVAHIETTNTPASIPHQGQFPCISVSFNPEVGVTLDEASRIIEQCVRDIQMPGSIRGGWQGTAKLFKQSNSSQPLLILAAILAVYIVLGILYESLVHPITILSTIPSAGLGALLALQLARMELSIVSLIGIVLLIGIVKKNAIMMVDFALEAERRDNLQPAEAIYQACIVRFRPITMTTLAAMFGAAPLVASHGVGSEIRSPLGVAIIGGLFVSQFLTIYSTPIIYLYLDRLSQKWRRWRNRPAAHPTPSEPAAVRP